MDLPTMMAIRIMKGEFAPGAGQQEFAPAVRFFGMSFHHQKYVATATRCRKSLVAKPKG
jgi:hypothetical protein